MAAQTESLPPWDGRRDPIKLAEIPAYLRRLYGLHVSRNTPHRWCTEGIETSQGRIYLKTQTLKRVRFAYKADIIAFLEAM